jgi:hypothetical protein
LVLELVVAERRDAVAWLNPSVVGDEDLLVLVGEFGDGGAERHVWRCKLASWLADTKYKLYVLYVLLLLERMDTWRTRIMGKRDAPTPAPTSRVLRALMERSGLTLPMT